MIAFPLAVALVVVVSLSLTSCSPDSGGASSGDAGLVETESGPPVGESALAASDVSRASASAPRGDVEAITDSIDLFAADLYRLFAEEAGSRNVVFSPTSIVTALAMPYAGAVGTTAEEMAATLHLTLEGDELHEALNSLDRALESRNRSDSGGTGERGGVLLRMANSLWAQKDHQFEQPFLDTLAAYYGAGVRLVDYKEAFEDARRAINAWVTDETDDKIPELLPKDSVNKNTRLVLVDAVYLDATWMYRFSSLATADGDFTTLAGETVTAPMMAEWQHFPYASGDGWQAVELPYVGGELAMLLIVPDQGGLAEVERGLEQGLIDDVAGQLTTDTEVRLTMPKFELRLRTGLKDALTALGMRLAFNKRDADFTGISPDLPGQPSLFIDDVAHEAYLSVDEEGTEAAAATGVTMAPTATTGQPGFVELTIDRPFLFALRDRETGAILFLGRVADPTAG